MLEYIILGFLMFGEKSGYDIKQTMKKTTSNFFDASFGSIYPALTKLEKKGYVVINEVLEDSKKKNIYSISKAGKSIFLAWLQQPIEFSKTNSEYLVKIYFYSFISKEKAVDLIKDFIRDVNKAIGELTEIEEKSKGKIDLYRSSTIYFGIEHYNFVIKWCEELISNSK
jgi:DNA-binding PadR family transcriptional regulator